MLGYFGLMQWQFFIRMKKHTKSMWWFTGDKNPCRLPPPNTYIRGLHPSNKKTIRFVSRWGTMPIDNCLFLKWRNLYYDWIADPTNKRQSDTYLIYCILKWNDLVRLKTSSNFPCVSVFKQTPRAFSGPRWATSEMQTVATPVQKLFTNVWYAVMAIFIKIHNRSSDQPSQLMAVVVHPTERL